MKAKTFFILKTLILAGVINSCAIDIKAQTKQRGFSEEENHIFNLEQGAIERWVNGDIWGFLDLYTYDFTYIDETTQKIINGYDKVKELYLPFNGKIFIHRHEFTNVQVKVKEDLGFLTYNLYNFNENGDTTLLWNCTEVYEKINKNWKITHSHWSIVKTKNN